MLVKPAEQTPLSAYALEVLALQAGLPQDLLLNIVGDAAEVGQTLCNSDVVRKLSFTGSTPVGRILMQQCAPTIKKLSLELGGNAPLVILDDADLDLAVELTVMGRFLHQGQICMSTNRVIVDESIHDAYVDKLIQRVKTTYNIPIAAYNVSGEYSMVKAAAANGCAGYRAALRSSVSCCSCSSAGWRSPRRCRNRSNRSRRPR